MKFIIVYWCLYNLNKTPLEDLLRSLEDLIKTVRRDFVLMQIDDYCCVLKHSKNRHLPWPIVHASLLPMLFEPAF